MISKQRLKEIEQSLDEENISYGEIAELEKAAEESGIEISEQMTMIDVLIELQNVNESN